jgi:hypothetical protein
MEATATSQGRLQGGSEDWGQGPASGPSSHYSGAGPLWGANVLPHILERLCHRNVFTKLEPLVRLTFFTISTAYGAHYPRMERRKKKTNTERSQFLPASVQLDSSRASESHGKQPLLVVT